MFWKLLGLFVILGIGIPILMSIYNGFVNSVNGSWVNWTIAYTTICGTTACVTAYSTLELGIFQIIPIIAALFVLGFILYVISGGFSKDDSGMGEDK